MDYDSTRHALEAVQNNNKKKDDIKLAKLRDDMEGARRLYDVLNKGIFLLLNLFSRTKQRFTF